MPHHIKRSLRQYLLCSLLLLPVYAAAQLDTLRDRTGQKLAFTDGNWVYTPEGKVLDGYLPWKAQYDSQQVVFLQVPGSRQNWFQLQLARNQVKDGRLFRIQNNAVDSPEVLLEGTQLLSQVEFHLSNRWLLVRQANDFYAYDLQKAGRVVRFSHDWLKLPAATWAVLSNGKGLVALNPATNEAKVFALSETAGRITELKSAADIQAFFPEGRLPSVFAAGKQLPVTEWLGQSPAVLEQWKTRFPAAFATANAKTTAAATGSAVITPTAQPASTTVSSRRNLSGKLPQSVLAASRRFNVWQFGTGAGIDFNSPTPELLRGNQLTQLEGTSSICDAEGNLLLYTDGQTVFNRFHEVIPGATGLAGHSSTTQAALIVPAPGHDSQYYIFTLDQGGYEGETQGLTYTLLDLRLNAGRGGVVRKNIPLAKGQTEKMAAVMHTDGEQVWIITHASESNQFLAWRVGRTGVASQPVVSALGSIHPLYNNGTLGQMKVSADGRHIAVAITGTWTIEVADFDATSGRISNLKQLIGRNTGFGNTPIRQPYGLEFAPDASQLLVSELEMPRLHSFDVAAGSVNSYELPDSIHTGALQLAPNGWVIGAIRGQEKLLVWNGSAPEVLDAPGIRSGVGLPASIANYTDRRRARFAQLSGCFGMPTQFKNNSGEAESYAWAFGDGATSTDQHPTHLYPTPGVFSAQLIVQWKDGLRDTVSHNVVITAIDIAAPQAPVTYQLPTTGSPVILGTGQLEGWQYQWSTGHQSSQLEVWQPGQYTLQRTLGGCSFTEVYQVLPPPSNPLLAENEPEKPFWKRKWIPMTLLLTSSVVFNSYQPQLFRKGE